MITVYPTLDPLKSMSDYSDFSNHGYQVERILGKNPTGGRVTYLATQLSTHQPVVVKQYQFAQAGLSWNGYLAYQSEIKILRSLYCHNIPRYLDSFETSTGFCLVQEYKNAPYLDPSYQYTFPQIKQIAVAILEVLVYLQKQVPSVIHGDLKPENILIDSNDPSKIYLVDFGFARMGSGDTPSSVIKGTLGFMPPEEMFNRELTKASDLYSLGVTIICLLTQTKSKDIGVLIDEKTYQLCYKQRLPKLHPQFVQWLGKMVIPSVSDRYSNAQAALDALQNAPVVGGFSVLALVKTHKQLSGKTLVCGLGGLGLVVLAAIFGMMHWQGRHLRQLLQTKTCQACPLQSINLSKTELQGVNLAQANLQGADLRGANLESANLQRANLQGAILEGVNLTGSNLEGALLQGAKLMGANLKGANLEGANLENAIISDANLAEVNLKYANLINTKLKYAKLTNATLEGANLGGTDLEGSVLQGATMPDGKKNP